MPTDIGWVCKDGQVRDRFDLFNEASMVNGPASRTALMRREGHSMVCVPSVGRFSFAIVAKTHAIYPCLWIPRWTLVRLGRMETKWSGSSGHSGFRIVSESFRTSPVCDLLQPQLSMAGHATIEGTHRSESLQA